MRNTVAIISNIAMLLCTAAAAILTLNQLSFAALVFLAVAFVFFGLKLVIGVYSEE